MSHSFHQFSGTDIYLDTTAFYAFLRIAEPAAGTLFRRIEAGELQAYTSVLTFDEIAYRLLLAHIRDHHPGSPLDNLRNDESNMIRAYYPQIATKLQRLHALANLTLLNVTAEDVTQMHEYILQHQLRPRDALHLAAMQKCGCFSLVSNDSDFDRIATITRYTVP